MNTRQIVVVDIESTGLKEHHIPIEVAAINLTTGEEFYFVPYFSSVAAHAADPGAMKINRYYERGVYVHADRTPLESIEHYRELAEFLKCNTFAGSNPRFDATKIHRELQRDPKVARAEVEEPWHHRLLDLSAYSAGVLGLDPAEPPGMAAVCHRLGVVNEEEHGAMGDARATAECFRRLREMRVIHLREEEIESYHGKAVTGA